ncbi:MAG: hypothetical protein IPM35_00180 [Myxococcales bacterium]|nr:hypothetical protein [Myxococcales bacterium]
MADRRALIWLALGATFGCARAAEPVGAPPSLPGPAASAARAPVQAAPDHRPALSLTLSPKLLPAPVVAVTLELRGPPDELRRLSLARAPASGVSAIAARDLEGPIGVELRAEGDGLVLSLARPPSPPLSLSYERAASAFSSGPLGVFLDPNRLAAAGDALFALPAAWADRPVPTQLGIEAHKLHPDARGASGFGVGARRTLTLSGAALRRMSFLAGPMGHAVLDGPEGHDEVAWLGYTSFDPRSVAAEVASFRSAAREYFGEKQSAPFTLLLVSDGRPAGGFDATRQSASVLLHVGVNQSYGGPLRVALAHQLLREWVGPALWIGPPGAESLWFVEGVTRFLARELCFRFGLLTPGEYLAEADEIERLVVTSPHALLGNAELAKRAAEPDVAALLVARGARHATSADSLIRGKSKGKRSLDGVLRELYRKPQPLPESAWVDALERELGAGGGELFREEIGAGRMRGLPNDALGPCFVAGPRRFESFALGFERDAGGSVTRVATGGAAERAGVRVGDRVVSLLHQPGSPSVPVRLQIERAGSKRELEYRPVGPVFAGRGFSRLPRVPEERCARK